MSAPSPEQIEQKIAAVLARPVATRTADEMDAEILRAAAAHAEERQAGARLLVRLDDAELAGVRRDVAIDAAREPLDDRRGMLVLAAAEAMLVDRSVAQVASTLRVIRGIDPADARELGVFVRASEEGKRHARIYQYEPREKSAQGVAGREFVDASPHGATLLATALVRIDEAWSIKPKPAFLTPRGELVLELLRAWLAVTK